MISNISHSNRSKIREWRSVSGVKNNQAQGRFKSASENKEEMTTKTAPAEAVNNALAIYERLPTDKKREDKKGRGGSNVVINYITPAGKQFLRELLDD